MDLRGQLPSVYVYKMFCLCQAKTFLSPFFSKKSNILKKVNVSEASQTEMNLNFLSEITVSVHKEEAWKVKQVKFFNCSDIRW